MLRTIVVLLIAALLPSAAHAEKRIALLIGNQSYSTEIGKLANPHNDIALLEKALKGLQFEVTSVRDARPSDAASGGQRLRPLAARSAMHQGRGSSWTRSIRRQL